MEWKSFDFSDKPRLLGAFGEKFVYDKLVKKYPKDGFLILDLHSLCEMDWAVIDKVKGEIIEVYEVKTTTKDKKEFSAGSDMQLIVFRLQQVKKEAGNEFIPSFLYVLRANKNFWATGNFEVLSEEIYSLDKITVDVDKCLWSVTMH